MQPIVVDLFSDTMTKPTPEMRRFLSEAEVGDEQRGEDPTVNRLQGMVCDLLGKEAAVFLPSGTMCNEIAFAVHCRPGDEILMDKTAHPLHYEAGGPAALAGAQIRPLEGVRGIFTPHDVAAAIRPANRHMPRSRLLSVEQTTNLGGGACWPVEAVAAVGAVAHERGLATHLDGARLLNAVVATGVPARAFAEPFDSAWIDFSKGLGAPVGAVLAGSAAFIEDAWRFKQRWGGAMRQAGIIAAAGIYALEHHIDRLADDHANARTLARGLAALPGITLDPDQVETNIVIFDVGPAGFAADDFAQRLLAAGVRMSVMGPSLVRAVTHLDIAPEQIAIAIAATARLIDAGAGAA